MFNSVHNLIQLALQEDIGFGDITTDSVVLDDLRAEGDIISKGEGIVAGLYVAREVLQTIDREAQFDCKVPEGGEVAPFQTIAIVKGRARSLLTAERTMLNFLQRLSGIATNTRKYVEAVSGYPVKVVDTRKTTPGWRALEKYAVRVGGGYNHRFGLYDAVLIKDNHIAVAGSITEAVRRARNAVPFTMKIEVETETMEQVKEALSAGADIIMLDNMDIQTMKEAVKLINHKAVVEASGGITLETIRSVAETGVDVISVGDLTSGMTRLDISMEVRLL